MKQLAYLTLLSAVIALSACNSDSKSSSSKRNKAPSADDASITTQADTPVSDVVTASDPDRDALTFAIVTQPQRGSLTLNADNGSYTYTPNSTLTGMDEFTFQASDGSANSNTATVSITIEALTVSFSTYSRSVFNQMESDEPLPVNGRDVEQDTTDAAAYDDLLL